MKGSRSRILTTHVGSLPRPDALLDLNLRRLDGEAAEGEVAEALRDAVADVVRRQVECGIDVVNDGEYGKSTTGQSDYGPWLAYAWERLGGWEVQPDDAPALMLRDAADFPTFYPTMWQEVGGARGSAAELIQTTVQTGPVTYTGHALVRRDLENLAAALEGAGAEEGFVTAVAPASFNRGQNRHYPSERDFLFALADALHEEYAGIVEAGFVLQVDDVLQRQLLAQDGAHQLQAVGLGKDQERASREGTVKALGNRNQAAVSGLRDDARCVLVGQDIDGGNRQQHFVADNLAQTGRRAPDRNVCDLGDGVTLDVGNLHHVPSRLTARSF